MSYKSTSVWFREQWSNPKDIFTILLIIGGDVLQKAIAQLTAGPVPYFSPVSFSFGWVAYSISAVLSAFGENKLMPSPEGNSIVINAESGYPRRNNSWLLARLLRDADHWIPKCLPVHQRTFEADKLTELRRLNDEKPHGKKKDPRTIHIALRITIWKCKPGGKGGHDLVYWSGVPVALLQIIGLGLPPLVLYREWFTIMVAGCGTILAWMSSSLPQWIEEKIGVRDLDNPKDVLLTEGAGYQEVLMLRSSVGCLDLETLAGSRRDLQHPRLTRIVSATLAFCWVALLITVAGWEEHTWYILGVGLIGIVHNVYVAGWERMPAALGINVVHESMFADDKVMKVLWQLEEAYPQAGTSALPIFFPGGIKEHEKIAWRFAADRYRDWKLRESPLRQDGKPDAFTMPASDWVEKGEAVDVKIFTQTV